ncbi:MAG: hypothetical protein M1277_00920 [Patescibacteria group bacterium]|nr:hypothetical protein [Patescibacteria group bacterium]
MVKLRNFNFRQTRSERAGENAYRNFRPNFFGKFKINPFNKLRTNAEQNQGIKNIKLKGK